MRDEKGFSPVCSHQCKVLILGSMPGIVSLKKQQYYANTRNAFWQIMSALFDFPADDAYENRTQCLLNNDIAIWDVMYSCCRQGSLDASIEDETIVTNDFEDLYSQYTSLKAVFFNGRKAEQSYMRKVFPLLSQKHRDTKLHLLPSTSPAYAAMPYAEKYQCWKVIRNYLLVE